MEEPITFISVVKDIAAVIGCITALIGFITLCFKSVRNWVKMIFNKQTVNIVKTDEKQDDDIKEIKISLKNIEKNQQDFQDQIEKRLKTLSEGTKDMLRHRIMTIYHRYKDKRAFPIHQKEALEELWKDYRAEGGNSYIPKYYNRMQNWDVIYTAEDEDF